MVGFLTQIGPKQSMSLQPSRLLVRHSPCCYTIINGELVPSRSYVDKRDSKPAKEEKADLKMPGFVQPDSINEEGYFTQKAKQQLEELRRRVAKEKIAPPETKI